MPLIQKKGASYVSSKLIVDSKVGVSCPDIGVVFDCVVKKVYDRSATVVNADTRDLPVFDPGTILRITTGKEVLWGVIAASGKTRMEITDIDDWDKKNRREFFRLSCLDAIDIIHFDEEDQPEPNVKGKLLDISAIGMRFSVPAVWRVGDIIQITWKNNFVEDGKTFHLQGQIVRTEISSFKNFYGCKFIAMPSREQDALMREIFKIQLKQNRKK
jgi:hypothetical protein